MRKLTDDEKIYLRIAYEKGYMYIAIDFSGRIYFYKNKPVKVKDGNQWVAKISDFHDIFESMLDFGATWEDEEPTRIEDLLGIDDTDWAQVKPFTPVLVRDSENDDWTRVFFLGIEYTDDERKLFKATFYGKWADDGEFSTWRYCRLATQEEIDEVKTDRH